MTDPLQKIADALTKETWQRLTDGGRAAERDGEKVTLISEAQLNEAIYEGVLEGHDPPITCLGDAMAEALLQMRGGHQ